jgi:hypothetical protein
MECIRSAWKRIARRLWPPCETRTVERQLARMIAATIDEYRRAHPGVGALEIMVALVEVEAALIEAATSA